MSNKISDFFRSLDGKIARVSSGGLLLEGTIEQECYLQFVEHSGLHCSVRLEFNRFNVASDVEQVLVGKREDLKLSYAVRDAIIDCIVPLIKNSYVQVGRILPYGVTSLNVIYHKKGESIAEVTITYEKGNCVVIRNIKDNL